MKLGVAAGLAVPGTLVLAMTGSVPAFAYSSAVCHDGIVPPGPGNFEFWEDPGALGFAVGAGTQGTRDTSVQNQIFFNDTCSDVTTPAINVPFIGTIGGEVSGGYTSVRVYTNSACTINQNDSGAQLKIIPDFNTCA